MAKATSPIGGWVVSVTTRAGGEKVPPVSLFDVAEPDPKDAMNAVCRACGAPAAAVAIKTHLTTAALALMRVQRGQLRMRKSFKRPRDIHQLRQRLVEMAVDENVGHVTTQTNEPSARVEGRRDLKLEVQVRAKAKTAATRTRLSKRW